MKSIIPWDMKPCSLVEIYGRFEGRTAPIFRVEK
jgi:hypothetical protein